MGTSSGDRAFLNVLKNRQYVANEAKDIFLWGLKGSIKWTFLPAFWINATAKSDDLINSENVFSFQIVRNVVAFGITMAGLGTDIHLLQAVGSVSLLNGLIDNVATCLIQTSNQNSNGVK